MLLYKCDLLTTLNSNQRRFLCAQLTYIYIYLITSSYDTMLLKGNNPLPTPDDRILFFSVRSLCILCEYHDSSDSRHVILLAGNLNALLNGTVPITAPESSRTAVDPAKNSLRALDADGMAPVKSEDISLTG